MELPKVHSRLWKTWFNQVQKTKRKLQFVRVYFIQNHLYLSNPQIDPLSPTIKCFWSPSFSEKFKLEGAAFILSVRKEAKQAKATVLGKTAMSIGVSAINRKINHVCRMWNFAKFCKGDADTPSAILLITKFWLISTVLTDKNLGVGWREKKGLIQDMHPPPSLN